MKDVVIYFDLFDTLIKINRGYLEEYFDKELDLLGDRGILKDSKMTINEIVKKNPEVLSKYSMEEMCGFYDKSMSDSLIDVNEDILEMLDSLKKLGYKLCIISDAAYVDIQSYDKSPISKYFDNAVFSCHYGITKPDQKIYNIANELMGNPSRTIFIGDGGHDEIVGAKKAGMKTIKVEWFKRNGKYDGVDYVINVPSYLKGFIDKI